MGWVTRPSVYLFMLACFVAGYLAVTVLSFGKIAYDERDGPGWSPVTKMPDGKTGLSLFALQTIGFVVLGAGIAALMGLAYIWIHVRRN